MLASVERSNLTVTLLLCFSANPVLMMVCCEHYYEDDLRRHHQSSPAKSSPAIAFTHSLSLNHSLPSPPLAGSMPLLDFFDNDETTLITPQEHQRRVEQWELAQKKFDKLVPGNSVSTNRTAKQVIESSDQTAQQTKREGMYPPIASLVR